MMTTGKKSLSALMAALMFTISLAGCGGGQRVSAPASSDGKIKVVDMAGREVEIPENVRSVAIIYGVITSYIVALGKADKLAAVGFKNDFFMRAHPVFETVGTVGS